jgi:hypothetical protein
MIDLVKEVNNKKYWKSLIRCLLKSTEEIPTRPTDEGWNQIPRPQPQPAPCPIQKKDINEDSKPHGEQDETSRPTQTHQDSKQHHHFLRQNKTESLHRNKLENT